MLAHFDLFALAVLVAGDLLEGLGLGDTLLLHLNPAEFLGHRLHDSLTLDEGVVVAVVAGVEIAGTAETRTQAWKLTELFSGAMTIENIIISKYHDWNSS